MPRNPRRPSAAPPRASERRAPPRPSSASGTSFQGDGNVPAGASSPSGPGQSGLEPAFGGTNPAAPNITANSSGPCTGTGSLVTDDNSVPSGGAQPQRSASINNESSACLPSSPMSFSDNNNNLSGSTVIDGSYAVQQGASTATSYPRGLEPRNSSNPQKRPNLGSRQYDVSQPLLLRRPEPSDHPRAPEPGISYNPQKKPRLCSRPDDTLQQHYYPQVHSKIPNAHLQAIMEKYGCTQPQFQQHQVLQQMQPAPTPQQIEWQRQARPQPHPVQPPAVPKQPVGSGLCAQRLMRYMYHQHHRPPDNSILYWRRFVTEYFSPQAKKRWCFSSFDNLGSHALGLFNQAVAWTCDICGAKSGKGFEATFEVLPRFCQIKFDQGQGAIDEVLFLGMPHEFRLPSGFMVLDYAKAVQESIYEQQRVVQEGQLRITFTPDLKILSWEFCVRRHEEFFPQRLVAPQVNQLLQVAQKYQTAVTENGSTGLSPQELQTSCNMFITASRQLAKSLQPQSLHELGFSKTFVRSLQISEVLYCMKNLFDFSQEHKIGPIDSLKNYPRQASASFPVESVQEAEQMVTTQSLLADHNTPSRINGTQPGQSSSLGCNIHTYVPNNPRQATARFQVGRVQEAEQMVTTQSLPADHNTPSRINGMQPGQSSSLGCNSHTYVPNNAARSPAAAVGYTYRSLFPPGASCTVRVLDQAQPSTLRVPALICPSGSGHQPLMHSNGGPSQSNRQPKESTAEAELAVDTNKGAWKESAEGASDSGHGDTHTGLPVMASTRSVGGGSGPGNSKSDGLTNTLGAAPSTSHSPESAAGDKSSGGGIAITVGLPQDVGEADLDEFWSKIMRDTEL